MEFISPKIFPCRNFFSNSFLCWRSFNTFFWEIITELLSLLCTYLLNNSSLGPNSPATLTDLLWLNVWMTHPLIYGQGFSSFFAKFLMIFIVLQCSVFSAFHFVKWQKFGKNEENHVQKLPGGDESPIMDPLRRQVNLP